MKKIIKVTQECIDNAVQGNCYTCPVGLALRLADLACVGLGYDWANGMYGFITKLRSGFDLAPSAVRNFALAFDSRQPVSPFEFELDDSLYV